MDPILIQSVRDAYMAQSDENQQAFGSREIRTLGEPALVAQISVPHDYAQSWVVTLGPATQPGHQGAQQTGVPTVSGWVPLPSIDALAVVEWGTGGSAQWALVDWFSGQSFTVFGAFVRVYAIVRSMVANADLPARFAGHITPGHSSRVAYRSVQYGSLAAAGSLTLAVPPFGKRVWLSFDRGDVVARWQLMILRGLRKVATPQFWSITAGMLRLDSGSMQGGPGLAFPVGTNFILILNQNVVQIDNIVLLYELAL